MKVAILGTWHVHTKEYTTGVLNNPNAEVAVVWDNDAERGKKFADEMNLPFNANLDAVLGDESIDSVVICTATCDHPEIMMKVTAAKKNIFTEKVLTIDPKDAEKVAEAVKAAEEAGRSAQSAAQAAQSAAQAADSMLKAQETQAAAEAAEYARQMAETYQKVVEIKAELIDYLAEAQAAAEKAEAERKAAEEARKAAEEAALAASKYTATFELAQLLHESETLTGHAREDYAKVIEDAKAAIEAAKTPEEVDEILAAAREALKTAGCPSTNFTDVEENGWYHTGVDFMVKNGFMNGVADDAFDVDGNLTRAQLVTILYRIAGEPESTATNPFADVADGQWYTNAVIWAAENGIVKGVNTTTFAPNDQITREQIATILFRYAKAEKVEGKLAGFPDAEKVSDYAADAMAWAVEQGLINGISESDGKTYLAPQETATRAQIAVILMRYLTAEN